jgi:hypothetical protein
MIALASFVFVLVVIGPCVVGMWEAVTGSQVGHRWNGNKPW